MSKKSKKLKKELRLIEIEYRQEVREIEQEAKFVNIFFGCCFLFVIIASIASFIMCGVR